MAVPAFDEFDVGGCPERQAPDQAFRPSPLAQKLILSDDVGARFVRGLMYAAPISVFIWALIALSVWLILSD